MTPRRTGAPMTARVLTVLALATTLTLAGCGGDSDTTTEPTPSDTALSPTPTKDGKPADSSPGKDDASKTPAPAPAGPTVQVTIKGDSVQPVGKQVDLGVGDTLTVDVDSDRAGEMHVHSTPEQTFDFKAGRSTFEITLDKPGTVDVEEHVSDTLLIRALVR